MGQIVLQGVCLFCGKEVLLCKGLKIRNIYICRHCEKEIGDCTADTGKYEFYVKGLKKIWCCAV